MSPENRYQHVAELRAKTHTAEEEKLIFFMDAVHGRQDQLKEYFTEKKRQCGDDLTAYRRVNEAEKAMAESYRFIRSIAIMDIGETSLSLSKLLACPDVRGHKERLARLLDVDGTYDAIDALFESGVMHQEEETTEAAIQRFFPPEVYNPDIFFAADMKRANILLSDDIDHLDAPDQQKEALKTLLSALAERAEWREEDQESLSSGRTSKWVNGRRVYTTSYSPLTLSEIVEKYGDQWKCVDALLRGPVQEQVRDILLGKPLTYADSANEEQQKAEMRIRLANPLYIAMARSRNALHDESKDQAIRDREQVYLEQFYAHLPDASVEIQAEAITLRERIAWVAKEMNTESEKRLGLEKKDAVALLERVRAVLKDFVGVELFSEEKTKALFALRVTELEQYVRLLLNLKQEYGVLTPEAKKEFDLVRKVIRKLLQYIEEKNIEQEKVDQIDPAQASRFDFLKGKKDRWERDRAKQEREQQQREAREACISYRKRLYPQVHALLSGAFDHEYPLWNSESNPDGLDGKKWARESMRYMNLLFQDEQVRKRLSRNNCLTQFRRWQFEGVYRGQATWNNMDLTDTQFDNFSSEQSALTLQNTRLDRASIHFDREANFEQRSLTVSGEIALSDAHITSAGNVTVFTEKKGEHRANGLELRCDGTVHFGGRRDVHWNELLDCTEIDIIASGNVFAYNISLSDASISSGQEIKLAEVNRNDAPWFRRLQQCDFSEKTYSWQTGDSYNLKIEGGTESRYTGEVQKSNNRFRANAVHFYQANLNGSTVLVDKGIIVRNARLNNSILTVQKAADAYESDFFYEGREAIRMRGVHLVDTNITGPHMVLESCVLHGKRNTRGESTVQVRTAQISLDACDVKSIDITGDNCGYAISGSRLWGMFAEKAIRAEDIQSDLKNKNYRRGGKW